MCDFCGKQFERKQSAANNRNQHFCSRSCYFDFRQEQRPTTFCDHCGKRIRRCASELGRLNHHFCNLECRNNFMKKRETLACEYCGEQFERCPSQIVGKEHVFCSNDCYHAWYRFENHPSWQGGDYTRYYGPNWEQQRRRARKRDGYSCRACGLSESELAQELCVHHLIPFSRFGLEKYLFANCLVNLCCLCPTHHGELEQLPLRQQIVKLHF